MPVVEDIGVFCKINGFNLLWHFVIIFALNGVIENICSNCLFTINVCSVLSKWYRWTAERKVSCLSFPVAFWVRQKCLQRTKHYVFTGIKEVFSALYRETQQEFIAGSPLRRSVRKHTDKAFPEKNLIVLY